MTEGDKVSEKRKSFFRQRFPEQERKPVELQNMSVFE